MNHRKMRKGFGKLAFICLVLVLPLALCGVGYAHWSETLTIEGTITTGEWDCSGTIGFWQNWDSHNTYTEDEIEGWLGKVDTASGGPDSGWLGPTNMTDMVSWLIWDEPGSAASMECKFLAQYLATRLNMETEPRPRLDPDNEHDISTYDPATLEYPDGYLGLGGSGTLEDIVQAMESKYAKDPTDKQFEIMKNICDALNNLLI